MPPSSTALTWANRKSGAELWRHRGYQRCRAMLAILAPHPWVRTLMPKTHCTSRTRALQGRNSALCDRPRDSGKRRRSRQIRGDSLYPSAEPTDLIGYGPDAAEVRRHRLAAVVPVDVLAAWLYHLGPPSHEFLPASQTSLASVTTTRLLLIPRARPPPRHGPVAVQGHTQLCPGAGHGTPDDIDGWVPRHSPCHLPSSRASLRSARPRTGRGP